MKKIILTRSSHRRLSFPLLFLLSMINVGAFAQYFPYEPAYNLAMFSVTRNVVERNINKVYGLPGKGKPASGTTPVSKAAATSLNFTSSAEVHTKVLETIASIAAKGDRTMVRHHMEVLDKSNFLQKFDTLLRDYGFNSSNMADVFAAYIVLSWQAVTGKDAASFRSGIESFRQNIHGIMDNNEQLKKTTNAEKQQTAETLSYLAMIFSYATQDQNKANNQKALAQTREYIRTGVIRISGIDLLKYELDQSGLRPK
ncbi:MAG: hypothetical protein J7578_00015 [Chitinophagaceae bacterium]|nr:hypothetical protein [Chitinophagaceae bacterium]